MEKIIKPSISNLRFNNGYAVHTFKSRDRWSCRVFPESILKAENPEEPLRYCSEEASRKGTFLKSVGATETDAFIEGSAWSYCERNQALAGKHEIYQVIDNMKAIGVHVFGQDRLGSIVLTEDLSGVEALQLALNSNVLMLSCEPSLFDANTFRIVMNNLGLTEIDAQRLVRLIEDGKN